MSIVEKEIKDFMDRQSSLVSNEEVQKFKSSYEFRISQLNHEVGEKEAQLVKQKQLNAELTQEMVMATNESG